MTVWTALNVQSAIQTCQRRHDVRVQYDALNVAVSGFPHETMKAAIPGPASATTACSAETCSSGLLEDTWQFPCSISRTVYI
jgi:hypothetical protein